MFSPKATQEQLMMFGELAKLKAFKNILHDPPFDFHTLNKSKRSALEDVYKQALVALNKGKITVGQFKAFNDLLAQGGFPPAVFFQAQELLGNPQIPGKRVYQTKKDEFKSQAEQGWVSIIGYDKPEWFQQLDINMQNYLIFEVGKWMSEPRDTRRPLEDILDINFSLCPLPDYLKQDPYTVMQSIPEGTTVIRWNDAKQEAKGTKLYWHTLDHSQMSQRQIEREEKYKSKHSTAAYDRGKSYLQAAELILKNAQGEHSEAKELLTLLSQDWDNKQGALRQKDLEQLQAALILLIRDNLYPDQPKYEGYKGFQKVKKELDNAENHVNWKHRETTRYDSQLRDCRQYIDNAYALLEKQLDSKDPVFEKLEDLKKILKTKYHDMSDTEKDQYAKRVQNVLVKLVHEKLNQGDPNNVPQEQEAQIKKKLGYQDKPVHINRAEIPISKFTKAQEDEWTAILGENKPKWFQSFADWEQNFLIQRVLDWQELPETNRPNLGDYLGPVPTTIRRYPGAPNAFHTQVTVEGEKGKFTFNKVRSGILTPVKMSSSSKKKKKEIDKATEHNLEQLMVAALEQKLKELGPPKAGETIPVSMPILLQTLYSPPLQPDMSLTGYSNTAMHHALKAVRKKLENPEYLPALLNDNGVNTQGFAFGEIDLIYSNRPVNTARGVSSVLSHLNWHGDESNKTLDVLERHVENQINQCEKNTPAELRADLVLARMAMDRLRDIHESKLHGSNTLWGHKIQDENTMAEIAALEQIVAGKVGVRIGSCVSGKDREEMITQLAIAQMSVYAKHGQFPPGPGEPDPQGLREEFIEHVARQFLAKHGQKLAGVNAPGCDGIKNISEVFGNDICNRIRDKARDELGVAPDVFDMIYDTQRVAGLNKLKDKKLHKHEASAQNQLAQLSGKEVEVNHGAKRNKAITSGLTRLRETLKGAKKREGSDVELSHKATVKSGPKKLKRH